MDSKKIKVLAIDDNPDNLITIKALVMEAFPDALLLTALTGAKGIELATSENPDVILLDVVMPGMDGFAVCEKLKADKHLTEIPVVFVTAIKGDKESRIRALEVGAEAFLAKPIDETELVAQIRAMVKIKAANIHKRDENARLLTLVELRTQELEKTNKATLNLLEDLKKENEARREFEEALLLSEEKYRFMTENSGDVIWHLDVNYCCDYISPADERMRGFSKDEVLGQTLWSILKPEGIELAKQITAKRLKDEKNGLYNATYQCEYEQICKDGSWVWTETNSTAHYNENREHIGFHGITRDISDRKLAEKSLRESEGKYRFMFANNPQPMIVYDLETLMFLEVNQSAINHYGYSREEFFSMSIKDIRPEEDLPAFMEDIEEAKQNFNNTTNEWRHIKKNGEVIFVQVTSLSIVSNGRNARHIMVSDITDRMIVENELRLSESKYFNLYSLIRSMSDTMPDMLWAKDLNNNYIFANKAFSEIMLNASNTSEPIGKNDIFFALREREAHIDNPKWHTFGEICANTDVLTLQEMKPMHFDEYGNVKGEFIYLDVHKAPLYNSNNELIGVVGSARDVTEKKEAEKNLSHLARLYSLLSEINQAIVKHKNQYDLFETVCRVAIEYGQFRMGWFGVFDEASEKIKPINSAGYNDGYLDTIDINPNSQILGKGPTGKAFSEGKIVFCNDIAIDPMMQQWKEEALKRGYKSSFAAPIFRNGKPYGTFTLYASETGFFKEDEQKLLSEIGENISYALDVIDSETARKQMQNELEISELKYRELMENSPEGITIYVDGQVAYVNKEALRLMRGKDKSELIGKTIVDFIHRDNQALVMERMKLVAMAPLYAIIPSVEEKYIRLDGTEVYVEIKVMPILYDGKPAIQLSGHDISDRKNTELALADTIMELKTIYDNSPVMMCVVNENADIQFANQAFAQLSESIQDDLKGEQVGDVVGCIHALENNSGCGFGKLCGQCGLRGAMLRTLNTGVGQSNIEHQTTLIHDGKKVEIFLLASTALILTGETKRLLLCLVDITARKQIEEALQESENHFNNLFEFSPISICEEDFSSVKTYFDELKSQGVDDFREFVTSNTDEIKKMVSLIKVTGVNQTSLKVFGAEIKEEIMQNLPSDFDNINIPVFLEEFVALFEGKIHFEGETQIETLKGEKRDLLLNLTVMPGSEDSLSKVLVSFIDITDRKRAEEALQKSEMFLRTFIDNTPFEIWARDINSIGILENKKVVDHYGSILGKQPSEQGLQDSSLTKDWERNNARLLKGEMLDEVIEFQENKQLLSYQKISFPIINKLEIIGIAGFNIDITERKLAEEALRNSQVQLKQFAAHLQDVREEEKKILAREIHDELGQILVALKIDLGLLKQKVVKKFEDTGSEDLFLKFDHLYILVDDTIKTTRKIMTNLRPEVLDLLGFIDAVKSYSREFKERHQIDCEFTCSVAKLEINSQQSMALFRIVQESLTNVAKHAKATSVKINLEFLIDKLVMEIIDNGVGFDEHHKGRSDSYGMIGMKERVFLLEGELSIVGKIGKGTSVKVSVPYKELQIDLSENAN